MPKKFVTGLVIGSILTAGVLYNNSKDVDTTGMTKKEKVKAYANATLKKIPYLHPKLKISEQAQWTTVEEIEQSLKDVPPMNVGFDIDDTVLFPGALFHVNYNKFCPDDQTPMRDSCSEKQEFWDEINASGQLALPKAIGKQLIEMHQRRGDNIFFITAREKSKHKNENITETLQKTFKIKKMNKVIYLGMAVINTDKPGKTGSIQEHNIKIFYGDSDADIAAARAAKIRGIRVLRAPNSQDNENMPLNGRYGEEVIIGSDF